MTQTIENKEFLDGVQILTACEKKKVKIFGFRACNGFQVTYTSTIRVG